MLPGAKRQFGYEMQSEALSPDFETVEARARACLEERPTVVFARSRASYTVVCWPFAGEYQAST